jgi:hypothetical protein
VSTTIFARALIAAAARTAATARAETPLVAGGDSFRVDGYASFEFERQLQKVGASKIGDDLDPNGSFDMDLFDIVVNWRGSDRLRVAADLTWEHGAATEDGRGNVAVEYAWLEYSLADFARLRAGKMFTPFGIYNEIHTAKPAYLTVKEPLATNKNNKLGSDERFFPRWGTGVALLGNGYVPRVAWDYVVAVTNGEQETTNPFERDDNKQKALQGRVRLVLADELELGGSFYGDEVSELDGASQPTGRRTRLLTYGAHAIWRSTFGPGLELEWVRGERRPSSIDVGPFRWGQAGTAMAWWTFRSWVTPYARAEWLDPDRDVSSDRAVLLIGGLNLRVRGGLVLKAEVDRYRAQSANADFAGGRLSFTEVKAAAVVGF